jgi:hypothetical protein
MKSESYFQLFLPLALYLMLKLKQSVALDVSSNQLDAGPADQVVHLRSAFRLLI